MRAVIVGPGRIGCGFAGQVLHESGFELVFIARDPVMVEHLNRVRGYRVSLTDGRRTREVGIAGVCAFGTFETRRAVRELASADLIVTAVGAGNLPAVAPLIAEGLRARTRPVNVLAMENIPRSSRRLRELVAEHYDLGDGRGRHGLAGALVERVVARRVGGPTEDRPMQFIGDDTTTFRVDAAHLVEPLPRVHGLVPSEVYEVWVKRKLYTYSAGHAAAAYLGYLKGYHYLHTAVRDREIRAAVLAAMTEGQRGLVARYGREIGGDQRDLLKILARFENPALGDRIERVGRDPQRKLGARERLVGAAQLAQAAGIRPRHLALAAAAALCFDDDGAADADGDDAAQRREQTIRSVCGLQSDRGLGRLVRRDHEMLHSARTSGGLLLSLGTGLWTIAPHANGNAAVDAPTNGHANSHTNGHANGHANGQTNGHANGAAARAHAAARSVLRRAGAGKSLHFMLVRRVPPVPSPVLLEVQEQLERRGFRVASGIAEEMLQRPDQLRVEHDLYVLKSHTELSLSLAGALHHLGAHLLHPWPTAVALQNKIVTSRLLRAAGIPAPDTWVTGDPRMLRDTLEERPLILKPYLGHRGQGLHIVRSPDELDLVRGTDVPMIAQEFIEGSGEDLKLYVVGDDVFGVRKRFSTDSFTRAGRACAVDPEVRRIALRCGEALGLGLYGMDLIEHDGRVWVVDVNTFPGYKGVPRVASRIADYIEGVASGHIALPQAIPATA
jgi:glutathione synthase/RimK-type ligase-like ATP-grasp enzyme